MEIPAVVAHKLAEYFGPNEYDYAAEILATARATADRCGKPIIDDDIVTPLTWVFGNIRRRKSEVAGVRFVLVDGKGDPIGDLGRYVVHSMEREETVCRCIDWRVKRERDEASKAAARLIAARESAFSSFYMLSKPGSVGEKCVRDSLATGKLFPDDYEATLREDKLNEDPLDMLRQRRGRVQFLGARVRRHQCGGEGSATAGGARRFDRRRGNARWSQGQDGLERRAFPMSAARSIW